MLDRLKYIEVMGNTESTKSISFTIANSGGSYLFINGNIGLIYLINIATNIPEQNKLTKVFNGSSQELSLLVTGNNVTVTTTGILWGQTLIIGSNLNA